MGRTKLCVEVGGTFTDWMLVADARIVASGKVPSTPQDPSIGVMSAVEESAQALDAVNDFMHGSTVATNAVIERRGGATALITTKGFRDVIFIQRQAKTKLFDLFYKQPEALVSRDMVFEVAERVAPDGTVSLALDFGDLEAAVRNAIATASLRSIGVCLLHSYVNPEHEYLVREFLMRRFSGLHVTLSSDVLPRFREFERASTTVIATYLRTAVGDYLDGLDGSLAEQNFAGTLSIMQANGGTASAAKIRKNAAHMVLSGPAAGVSGAIVAARQSGYRNLMTFDMGGTSTDVCLVTNGRAQITTDYKIDGLPLSIPLYDIVTVGAGGGSIAQVDPAGALKVGPVSAGAYPGPACYGNGGSRFTVCDADLMLGLLRPQTFFGGKMTLSVAAARAAALPLMQNLSMSEAQVAEGVVRIADATMAQAMRLVSVERGHDPRDYTLVAFGGAGPMHACALADELGIRTVLVPENAGLMSAFGLAHAQARQDYIKTHILSLDSFSPAVAQKIFTELLAQAHNELAEDGLGSPDVAMQYSLDMRFGGQAYELNVKLDSIDTGALARERLIADFRRAHVDRYDHVPSGKDVIEIVNFRLVATKQTSIAPTLPEPACQLGKPMPPAGCDSQIFRYGRMQTCRFFDRNQLFPGFAHDGHVIIEDPTATTYVPDGWKVVVDPALNLIITKNV